MEGEKGEVLLKFKHSCRSSSERHSLWGRRAFGCIRTSEWQAAVWAGHSESRGSWDVDQLQHGGSS